MLDACFLGGSNRIPIAASCVRLPTSRALIISTLCAPSKARARLSRSSIIRRTVSKPSLTTQPDYRAFVSQANSGGATVCRVLLRPLVPDSPMRRRLLSNSFSKACSNQNCHISEIPTRPYNNRDKSSPNVPVTEVPRWIQVSDRSSANCPMGALQFKHS